MLRVGGFEYGVASNWCSLPPPARGRSHACTTLAFSATSSDVFRTDFTRPRTMGFGAGSHETGKASTRDSGNISFQWVLLRLEWTRTEDRGFVFEIRRILNPWFDRFEGQVIPVNEEADPKKTIQILANMVAEFEPAGKPIVLLFARSSISLAGACVWVQS